ncbi:MAG TPA: amino acid ABC transporter permease [Chloroflexota bacterium]|nr:amino acid ABC transporter permease [Chloroflexota bacterium]
METLFDPRRWAAFTELSVWQNTVLVGLRATLSMAAIAMVVSLVAGLALALLRVSPFAALRYPVGLLVETIRSLPVILLIFFSSLFLPRVGLAQDPFVAATAALAVYTAAVNAEIMRAGITAIERGQIEAARSLGMTYAQTMRHVILPQALQRVVPPQVSQLITLLKDTSLAAVVGVNELTRKMQILYQFERPPNPLQALFVAACIYFILNYSLSRLSRRWELGVGGAIDLH